MARGLTLTNETVAINRGGNIKSCKMESNYDIPDVILYKEGAPDPVSGNINEATVCPTLQRYPATDAELTSTVGAYRQQPAEDGGYFIAKVTSLDWKDRNKYWKKCHPDYEYVNYGDVVTRPDSSTFWPQANRLFVTDMNGEYFPVFMPGVAGSIHSFDGNYTPTVGAVCPAIVDPQMMAMDTTFIRVNGLTTSSNSCTFTLRFHTCIECSLHNNSPYVRNRVLRPMPDSNDEEFIRAVLLYASRQSGMYPADFNFWDKVWSGFKKVWNFIAPIRKVLPGMLGPGGGSIAGTADNLISQLVAHN